MDAATGEVTALPSAPLLSPDGKRFVTVGAPYIGSANVQIWSLERSRLRLETDWTFPMLANIEAHKVEWVGPTDIQIELQPSSDQPKARLRITATARGWKPFYNGAEVVAPALYPLAGEYDYRAGYGIGNLEIGQRVYSDRDYRFTESPAYLLGQQFLRLPNNVMNNAEANYIHFTLAQPAMLYVAIDNAASELPAWLALDEGWTATKDILRTEDAVELRLYKKKFAAGPVTLGGNWMSPAAGIRSHYVVIAVPTERYYLH